MPRCGAAVYAGAMRSLLRATIALTLALPVAAARAETSNVSANGFTSQFRDEIKATPDVAWRAIVQPARWWSSSHTYSGQASNLSLEAQAGGCWCERWGDGQSVQHGVVVLVMPNRLIRLLANFGPLQELPVQGVLTITIGVAEGKTTLRLTYRVGGPPDAGLEKLAPLVDGVIGEQYKRLKALAETDKAD
jgi:uncharacterized protein YndB with AHSA1/START domain